MDILRRPAGTMMAALVLSILYGVIRTGKLEVILNLWAIVGISLLVLAIHEPRTCGIWCNRWFDI